MMSDDEAKKLGQLVSKVDKHVAGCLTVGYAIMIFAQLIKGNFKLNKNHRKFNFHAVARNS